MQIFLVMCYGLQSVIKPNGLIKQWGIQITDSDGGCNLSFYVSFKSTNYVVMVTQGYFESPDKTVGYKRSVKETNSIRIGVSGNTTLELSYRIIGY